MLKLKAQGLNGPITVLGLSQKNIEKLQDGLPIKFDLAELGGEGEMLIFAGSTEEAMLDELVAAGLLPAEAAARVRAARYRADQMLGR
ncbi:MAG: hypothetical protein ACXWVD_00350 [Telluria sp.]